MNSKRIIKIIIIAISISLLFLVCLYKYTTRNDYKINSVGDSLAVYIKADGEESYAAADTIPRGFYSLNEENTKCSNGATVKNYDSTSGSLTISMTTGTFCTLYFDEIHVDSDASVSYTGPSLTLNGNYTSTISCTDGTGSYDAKTNSYNLTVTGSTSCTATTTANSTNQLLSTVVSNLVATTAERTDWRVVSEDGYAIRYKGVNPDNYVWFNNELWRIIGVMDSNQTGEDINEAEENVAYQTVKIIRANIIDNFTITANDDPADIYDYLDEYYYTRTNGTNADGYTTLKAATTGLTAESRNMIQDYKYPTTVTVGNNVTIATFYSSLYDSASISNENEYHVGLLNEADYFYAMADFTGTATGCTSATTNSYYRTRKCAMYNWLYLGINEKTVDGIIFAGTLDDVTSTTSYNGYIYADEIVSTGLRPVVQLRPGVYVIDGTGTYSNPYILGYDS